MTLGSPTGVKWQVKTESLFRQKNTSFYSEFNAVPEYVIFSFKKSINSTFFCFLSLSFLLALRHF